MTTSYHGCIDLERSDGKKDRRHSNSNINKNHRDSVVRPFNDKLSLSSSSDSIHHIPSSIDDSKHSWPSALKNALIKTFKRPIQEKNGDTHIINNYCYNHAQSYSITIILCQHTTYRVLYNDIIIYCIISVITYFYLIVAKQFLSSRQWPDGLQQTIFRSCKRIPMRFFIVDDSGRTYHMYSTTIYASAGYLVVIYSYIIQRIVTYILLFIIYSTSNIAGSMVINDGKRLVPHGNQFK